MAEQPKAQQVSLDQFIEVATLAALRALDARNQEVALNPQPLPPGAAAQVKKPGVGPIIIGIVAQSSISAE